VIKGVGKAGDSDLVILGLAAENVRRLTDGQPIRVDLAEVGLPGTVVVICYGQTEEAIMADMQAAGLMSDNPEVHHR
jgi:hypothetical protein